MSGTDWRALGAVAPGALGAARVELHWAATTVEQVGKSRVEPEDDYSHAAFRWSPEHGALVTAATPAGTRAGLALTSAEVLKLGARGDVLARLGLSGQTLDEAALWVRAAFAEEAGPEGVWKPLRRDGLPGAGVAEGAAFSKPGTEHRELASWYGNAAAVLGAQATEHPEAGPLLCWPHHFDIATRLDFEPDRDPEEARSVGLGFSPGDDGTPEPYFYILPWPAPEPESLTPDPDPGEWVTEGFVGGRLTGSALMALDLTVHAVSVTAFLSDGLTCAKGALGL